MKQQYASLTILITSALVTNNCTTTQDSSHHEPQTTSDWERKMDSRSCERLDSNFPRYMQRIGRIRHLAETLSHFPLLTTCTHLATRTATSLCDAPRMFNLGSVVIRTPHGSQNEAVPFLSLPEQRSLRDGPTTHNSHQGTTQRTTS